MVLLFPPVFLQISHIFRTSYFQASYLIMARTSGPSPNKTAPDFESGQVMLLNIIKLGSSLVTETFSYDGFNNLLLELQRVTFVWLPF